MTRLPRIGITPGEPAGIGPDICLLACHEVSKLAEAIYYADPDLLRERAALLKLDVDISDTGRYESGKLNVNPVPLRTSVTAGYPDPENAAYVLETLASALASCVSGNTAALVTGPVNKALINEGGTSFSGHTEWLADQTTTPRVVMMLLSGDFRVALATTHLPLTDVPAAITAESLTETLTILLEDLTNKFGISRPRVSVCGLNPHAGEGGHLGSEESEIIIPVIDSFRARGVNLIGPIPADTAFTRKALDNVDAVLAMYHDQGLPVIKHAAFGNTVNVTLGLPIIRTSVDHGTAFEIAGSGHADTGSLIAAVRCATEMVNT
ncbi:MAG: 4-hydroxythreonine-4-phosphate dehydrogenase PdxA [Gammaproteobacteria bacterium]|jgi:4-hydroxythreonine-4-phosphate dehydrogenase|nr:4-hydroxythreonine-4-phosphate dehydrogenase PdxA [Gammaproteobacteria bacterium]MBT4494807.1 4-hydroxythreonine-4-phosphate dehydrogenase PdxA [Gammaproteobacteria bacterium]MBT7369459.1 4-hydroxythreonine-4-phosphate dehydrogenase PdxA [Gammaproteobacteria bacterium]